jgi:hypothetical protein
VKVSEVSVRTYRSAHVGILFSLKPDVSDTLSAVDDIRCAGECAAL